MKNAVFQYTKQAIKDNKKFIDDNIAEYLLHVAQSSETGYHWYLSEDELVQYDQGDADFRQKIQSEIEDWINDNWNFNINEFEY